jgi:hypothetical protein
VATDGIETRVVDRLRWDLLSKQLPSGEKLTVRMAYPGLRKDLLIGLDSSGRRHLLVEVPVGEPADITERTSRGIGVQSIEMNIGGGALQIFIDVACLESYGESVIDTIAEDLLAAMTAGATITRVALVQNVLAKWRRFWSGVSHGLLAHEKQLGLFGELWFFARWLVPNIGFSSASKIWRGPLGARNDFEAPGVAIEVKTTSRMDATCKINGLEQLIEPQGGRLYLFGLSVREEASSLDCLPSLISEIRKGIGADYATLAHFETVLYAADYQDGFEREYGKLKLRVRREELFSVQENFPRLTPNSLATELPHGIAGITYELNLDAAVRWRVASSADEAKTLVQDLFFH